MRLTLNKKISVTFLTLCSTLFLFPISFPSYLGWHGLDPSWQIALMWAQMKGYVFGRDIIFTYGPLDYLHTRMAYGVPHSWYLFTDIFLLLNGWVVVWELLYKNTGFWARSIIFSSLILMSLSYALSSTLVIMLGLCYIYKAIEGKNPLSLFYGGLFGIFSFYDKLNTGIPLIAISFIVSIYMLIQNKTMWWGFLMVIMSWAGVILLSVYFLPIDLYGYLRYGLEVIKGYNEIMYYYHEIPYTYLRITLALIMGILLVFLPIWYYKRVKINGLTKGNYLKITVLMILYLAAYKYVATRATTSDALSLYLPLLGILSVYFFDQLRPKVMLIYLLGLITLYFPFTPSRWADVANTRSILPQIFSAHRFTNYTKGVNFSQPQLPNPTKPRPFGFESEISAEMRTRIGMATVDVFPWEVSALFCNGLNYAPRPTLQSYTDYTPTLDSVTAAHFYSQRAPKYILYRGSGSIDNREATQDEPQTKLALLKNYFMVDKDCCRNWLLLVRRDVPLILDTVEVNKYEVGLNDTLHFTSTASDEIEILKAFITPTIIGRVRGPLFYPAQIMIDIFPSQFYASETPSSTHRFSKSMARNAILSMRLGTIEDYANFFTPSEWKYLNKIGSFRFLTPQGGYRDKIILHHYRLRVRHISKDLALGLRPPLTKCFENVTLPIPTPSGEILSWVDNIQFGSHITASGWAFPKDATIDSMRMFLAAVPVNSSTALVGDTIMTSVVQTSQSGLSSALNLPARKFELWGFEGSLSLEKLKKNKKYRLVLRCETSNGKVYAISYPEEISSFTLTP